MKLIPLTRGQFAEVDDADFARFGHLKWCAVKKGDNFYAVRKGTNSEGRSGQRIYLHREILNVANFKIKVDHRDRISLNCRRENLRACTHLQNNMNRGLQKNSTSGIRGVRWHKRAKKWYAEITVDGKTIHLGSFDDKDMAGEAYIAANRKFFGEFGGVL